MALLKKRVKKIIIPNYKKDIEEVKKQVKELSQKLSTTSETSRIYALEKELLEMKEKYLSILEKLLSQKTPTATPPKQQSLPLSKLQLLFLLKQSKATTPQLAVSATQLKKAFFINKSEKTIRRKLLELADEGYLIKFKQKPILFYLSQEGLDLLEREKRLALRFTNL